MDLAAESDGTSVEYFAYDGLGSVRQILDSAGSPLLAQTFDPYGNSYSRTGTGQSAFGYTGEQTDSNGLVFLRARYYNPAQGRFMQMDPSRQEDNPYQYAVSNPILHTDPSGLSGCGSQGCAPEDLAGTGSQSSAIYMPITIDFQGSLADLLWGCGGVALDFLTGFLHQLLADEFMYPTHAAVEFLGMEVFGSSLYYQLVGGMEQLIQERNNGTGMAQTPIVPGGGQEGLLAAYCRCWNYGAALTYA